MKKTNLILTLILFNILLTANDGVFYASGNTLIPLEETKIELRKEILSFDNPNDIYFVNQLDVNIHFEFFNPDQEVEKLVGFVTPPASGVDDGIETEHPQITNFTVNVNNEIIDYNIAKLDSTEFKVLLDKVNGQDFIYYFKVKFKKGVNIIKHTYSYQGSVVAHPADPGPYFSYRLTTGKTWANKQIDDFELRINLAENTYFSVPSRFNKTELIDWDIQGKGRIGDIDSDKGTTRRIKIESGTLIFKTNDFQPDFDLGINILNPYADIVDYGDFYFRYIYDSPRELSDFSDSDLRILRNSFYAMHGYSFKSQDLSDYFNQYDWYCPNAEIKSSQINLKRWEKGLVEKLVEEENKRKSD